MNSSIINISEVLNNAKNLISAGFSSGYNFNEINAAEYFDELIENSTLPTPIFSGIIIMEKSEKELTLIDGLQRITTICLLLCALCEIYKNTTTKNETAKNKIFNMFLLNNDEPKLQLKNREQDIYKKILFSEELNEEELKNNLCKTYQSFLSKISARKISGTQLFKIISKIQFMVVITTKSEISTRELYQALNYNKDKFQVNLISDFITQIDLVAGVIWQETTDCYYNLGHHELLKTFLLDFLTIQNDGKIPNKNALYNKFKSYFNKMENFQDAKTITLNICKYAQYYLKIINADFENLEIKEEITILNNNNGNDAYPYLMEAVGDLENGHIHQDMFLDILRMINSFIISRIEDPDCPLKVDFASLSTELNKMLVSSSQTQERFDDSKLTINEMNNLYTFEV